MATARQTIPAEDSSAPTSPVEEALVPAYSPQINPKKDDRSIDERFEALLIAEGSPQFGHRCKWAFKFIAHGFLASRHE